MIERIFELIEPTQRYAVEFGAAAGIIDSNVRNLVVNHGWSSLQIEGDPERALKLEKNYRDFPNTTTLHAWVWPGNVEILFEENGVPKDLDLLVIDIDSNDYYVWRAIQSFRPKVVLIEVNALHPPPLKRVIEFHPMNYWDGTAYAGASLQSLYELGKRKGYELVYHTANGVNAFFVDDIYFPLFGLRDNSPEALYRPYPKPFQDLLSLPVPPEKEYLTWENLRIEKRFVERPRTSTLGANPTPAVPEVMGAPRSHRSVKITTPLPDPQAPGPEGRSHMP